MFLLFLGSVVPVLQPNLHLIQNAENPVLIEVRFMYTYEIIAV